MILRAAAVMAFCVTRMPVWKWLLSTCWQKVRMALMPMESSLENSTQMGPTVGAVDDVEAYFLTISSEGLAWKVSLRRLEGMLGELRFDSRGWRCGAYRGLLSLQYWRRKSSRDIRTSSSDSS